MSDGCTVVIGAQNHLDALTERSGGSGEVLAFNDTQALAAIETITTRKPQVVALERLFAATSRGAALINRIKADPTLDMVEIRVISHDGEYSRVSRRRAAPADTKAAAAPQAAAHLDWRGTRRAPRVRMADGTEAQVDGAPAALVDLSVVGAQVIAQSPLKPNQRVRITLADEITVVRFDAAVVWASFEIPRGITRYRAGVEFMDGRPDAIQGFALRHKSAS